MSYKRPRIVGMVQSYQGRDFPAHYIGFFDTFNRQLFYEAHEVLEDLWLRDKFGANGDFYKGLIQLSGAFVHLQKNRLRPAAALFNLTRTNLQKYPRHHEGLDLAALLRMIAAWLHALEDGKFAMNPLTASNIPQLPLPAKPAAAA